MNSIIKKAITDSNVRWSENKEHWMSGIEEYKEEEGELSDCQATAWYEAFMKEK